MPTSQHLQINEIIDLVVAADPSKVLDIGVGFGKYGFLTREYLELWDGRDIYGSWTRIIDGIEACEKYITPVHKFIYDEIFIGNALEVLPTLKKEYDLILLIDVFEHFDYDDGLKLLEECLKRSKNILISVPKHMTHQGDVFDNEYEAHLFQWEKSHFKRFPEKIILPNVGGSLIVFLGEKTCDIVRKKKQNRIKKLRKSLFNTGYLIQAKMVFMLDKMHLKEPLKRLLKR
jgi:hypothetical protein